jgi:hypothetical protein
MATSKRLNAMSIGGMWLALGRTAIAIGLLVVGTALLAAGVGAARKTESPGDSDRASDAGDDRKGV